MGKKISEGSVLEEQFVTKAYNPYLTPPQNTDFLTKLDHWATDFAAHLTARPSTRAPCYWSRSLGK